MKKIIGICDLHNEPNLGELTKSRSLGSVSFLGRYGMIDFTLSNFSNSGIDRVYVLVRKGIVSLRKHIGSGSIWTNNTKRGFVELLINEKGLSNKLFNTDIKNIQASLDLEEAEFDYAVIAPSYMLASMDFRPIIDAHIKSEADITCIYKHVSNADVDFIQCDNYKFDNNNHISKVIKNIGRTAEADISLDTFIVSKKALRKIVNDSLKVSETYSVIDMINYFIEEEMLSIKGYEFKGYVVPIISLPNYVNYSLDLLNYHVRCNLFLPEWPIYTTTHNTPPALYSKDADVQNSFVANGAIIKGKVTNSIISRDVVIEKGADIKNSLVFTKSFIGKDTKLEYVLCDKGVSITSTKKVAGSKDQIVILPQGAKL